MRRPRIGGKRPLWFGGALLLAAAVLSATAAGPHAATRKAAGGRPAVPGQIIVGFRAGLSTTARAHVLAGAGATAQTAFRGLNAVVARAGRTRAAIARLERDPNVRYAEPNFILRASAVTPNDPSFPQEWGLNNVGQTVGFLAGVPGADIHAKAAWDVTTGSASVTVAVLDTGLDFSHPDLAPNAWINPGENCSGCRNDGIDNDHDGYVDDWRGWDFFDNDNNPTDDNGHGTHVSGTIGAVGNNGIGVTGVDWNVKLMALKFLGADGSGTTDDAVRAILYAVQNGAVVLNNSYGGTEFSQALSDAIGFAEAHNALFVAAAGNDAGDNDKTPTYPGSDPHPNVVSVAATNNQDQRAWFSNYGRTSVDLGAPGDSIYSTWPGGGYALESGTSMATPHVAGVAALAKAAFPAATAVGLKALLLRTVDANSSLAGRTTSGGRLNANAAVRCTGAQAWIEAPAPGFVVAVGDTVPIAAIGAACGAPAGATVTATVNGGTVALTARGDGLYTGSYTATSPGPIRVTVSAASSGGSDSRTVAGQVPMPIVPGGQPVTVSVTSPGDTALLAFHGSAGQRVSLQLSGVTMNLATVALLKPDGSALGSSVYVGTSGAFVDTRTLPVTGTYTLVVTPQGTATGNMTLTLYDVPPDAGGAITPGGAPVTANTTVPGQNAHLTFQGSAGQRVSLKLSGVTMNLAIVALLKPDGTALGSTTYIGTAGGFVDTRTLPVSGTYTIMVDPQGTAAGGVTLTLYDVPPDAGGTIVPSGAAVTVNTIVPGQNAQLTFQGTAGQRVSLNVSAVTMNLATVALLKPDGTALGATAYISTAGGFLDTRSLPVTGKYTLAIDPQTTVTGGMTLTLYDVPPDAGGTIVPGGAPVTVNMAVPGQNALLTFQGTAGERVSLKLSGVTTNLAIVAFLKPDGTTLGSSAYIGTAGGFFDTRALPVTGTYTITVDPQNAATGSMTLTLYDVPPDATATVSPGGAAATVSTTVPGQNAAVRFDATAGQSLTLQLTGVTISASQVSITAPDGSTALAPASVFAPGRTFTVTVAQNGTYTIVVDPQGANVGNVTVKLT